MGVRREGFALLLFDLWIFLHTQAIIERSEGRKEVNF
jgi:hypothetical protein